MDKYWGDAANSILTLELPEVQIIVPHEILPQFEGALTYGASFVLSPEDQPLVIMVHKGRVDDLSLSFIQALASNYHYYFGNEVFNVFVSPNISVDTRGDRRHLFDYRNYHTDKRARLDAAKVKRGARKKESEYAYGRTLIISANNFGNVGDDAITHAAYNLVLSAMPETKIEIAAPPISRDFIKDFDLVVLGGGGLFYDGRIENAMNYTNYLFFAHEAEIPTFSIGIGTQGIKTNAGRMLFKAALDTTLFTAVRDPKDKDVLDELEVSSPVILTQDIVFSLPSPKSNIPAYYENDKKTVAIALLDSRHLLASKHMKAYQQGIKDVVEYLSENYNIVYVVQSFDDIELYRELRKSHGGKIVKIPYENALEGETYYRNIDLCVTSRFHGLIFSTKAGIPVISVGTNGSKTDRLIKNFIPSLREAHIPIRNFTLDAFKEKLDLFENEPERLTPDRQEILRCISESESTSEVIRQNLPL